MAGQGRTLFLLGGVLAVGIAAAIWAVMSESTGPVVVDDGGANSTAADSPDAPAKSPTGAPRRAKKAGSAAVVGEIRRSKGKVPVEGQEVQLLPEKGEPWTVTTDARGAFKLGEIPHGGPYELRVEAKGCGTIRIPGMALDRNESRDVGTLWLDPSVSVTVQVRAWSDQPVAGALVEAFAVAQADNFDWSKAYAQMGQAPVAVTKATTDAEGRVVFPQLATGRWTFTAAKEGFARSGRSGVTVRADVEPPPVRLFLGSGHALAGKVRDAAKAPVAGALVLTGPANSQWDLGTAPLRARTTTNAEGSYAFASLDAGDTLLLVGRPGGGIPNTVATLRIPNVREFDVFLKGTATVTGAVTEKEGGKPIEGAKVRAWNWGSAGNNVSEAATDAEGRFALAVIEGNVGSVTAEKEGWVSAEEPGRQRPPLPIREGETQSRDVQLKPGAKVAGVVKGPDGPLAGAKVWVHTGTPNTGWAQKSATSDADGRYEVASLVPGQALVRAEFAGWYVKDFPDNYWMVLQSGGASPFKVDVPEGGAATKDVEMVHGVPVEGRVEGPDGPLAGVRVTTAQDWEGGVVTGADGAFRVEGVKPSASVVLYATKEGYAPSAATKPIAVTADQPATGVVLRMVRVGLVKGTVTVADGSPLVDARVSVAAWQDRGDGMSMESMEMTARAGRGGVATPVRPDGTYEAPLGGMAAGRFRVLLTALDRPAAQSDPVPIVEGQSEYFVPLTVDGGKDLAGRVVVKQGGAGVPGALVSIQSRQPRERGMSGGMVQTVTGDGGGGQTVWAITDAEGKFAVAHLASGTYAVQARADGYVPRSVTAELAAGSQVTVELEPELAIEGVVVLLAGGSPVEGANVNSIRDEGGGRTVESRLGGGEHSGGAWSTTGSNGRFRLTGLPSGSYRLRVSPDWQGELNIRSKTSDPVAAGATDVKIAVDAGGIIAGRVLDPQKKGVGNIWISANPEPKDGKPREGAESRNARTRQDGSFSVTGLADTATYALQIQANQGWDMPGGSTLKSATLKGVSVGTTNIEVILEEGLTITGTLVDTDARPLPNAYLMCQSMGPDGRGVRGSRSAMTDGSGVFAFGGLDAGDCQITMQEWGGPTGGLVVQNGDKVAAGSRDVRLVAGKGVTITGSVVDEAGSPVKGSGVNAFPKSGGQNRSARVKDDGTFEITGLAAGTSYKLLATAPGRPTGKADDVAANANGVSIVLPRGLEASGRVFDDAGVPVKESRVYLRLAGDPDQAQSAQTDADGNFKVQGLLDAVYDATVFVRTAQGSGNRRCGTLRGGETGAELRVVEATK